MDRTSSQPVDPRGSWCSYHREPLTYFPALIELVEITRHTGPVTAPVSGRSVGAHALLVEVDDAVAALALATWARAVDIEAVEVVPGAASVLFDGVRDPAALLRVLGDWTPGSALPPGELVEVQVVYDGADLDFVAESWALTTDEVVARHAALEFVAAFCGFAPGFSYLSGLPDDLAVPRLDTPRSKLPAGSVALAGSWCGIYPTASPGGWRIIGRTDVVLWDQDRAQPALLPPGTRVRFRDASSLGSATQGLAT
ncbi:MAG: Allophanate hydrolase subunit 1 [Nocardioides sp.]|nr:Allophanate hydrolase subunit 1 [Nocardioides sp.]